MVLVEVLFLKATIIYIKRLLYMQKQRKTNLAIEELQLKINPHDSDDKYQLAELLVDILAYPTVQEAQIHRNANRLGNFDLLTEQDRLTRLLSTKNTTELIICPCCGNIENQITIKYCSPIDNIKLGIGVRLYFLNLIYYISIFFLGFLLYSLYSMITNINASKQQIFNLAKICQNTGECSTANIGIGSKLTSNNSFQNQLAIQAVLGLIYVILWGIIMAHKYFNQINLQVELKSEWLSASQFTLMIKNMPKQYVNFGQDQVLKKMKDVFFQYQKSCKSQVSFEVMKVSVGYPLYKQHVKNEELKRINQQQMKKRRDVFIEWLLQRQHKQTFDVDEQKRNERYEDFYDFVTNVYFKSDVDNIQLQDLNIVFVTLRYSKARELIEKMNRKEWKLWYFCTQQKDDENKFPIQNVQISRAPQPDQIKWQNIGFPNSIKIIRKILIFSLALLLIGVSLAITIFLARYQLDSKQYIISILISLVITIINYIIELIMIILSLFENEIIKTQEEASIGLKIAVFQILNCILVPILLTYITQYSIYTQGGLVTNVFFISLINMILPLGRLIDPFNILLKIFQKYYSYPSKRLLQLKGQAQLNKLYSYYQFELGFQYTYIIKTSFFTSFFLTLQPVIAIFASVGLTLMFFTNKYRILYRFKKPNFHSSSVNNMLSFILKIAIINFAIGQLYFINFQSKQIEFNLITNWITLGLSVVLALFPLRIFKRFYKQNRVVSMDYNQKLLYLTTDYDRMNPKTKQKAIQQFRQYLQEYEKKCNIPLPEKSLMIKKSIIEIQKNNPLTSFINLRQKTKTKILFNHKQYLGSQLHSGDRIR